MAATAKPKFAALRKAAGHARIVVVSSASKTNLKTLLSRTSGLLEQLAAREKDQAQAAGVEETEEQQHWAEHATGGIG